MSESGADAVEFLKGHGTGNDFVILPDPDDRLELTPAQVRALCDRRFGIGADGVLRVAPSRDGWFMDYRNADGTIAEMCGNGARVFATYLVTAGLVDAGSFAIVTRGGTRLATVAADGIVSVAMGAVTAIAGGPVDITVGGRHWTGIGALAPNPHAVTFVADVADVGDITGAAAGPADRYPTGGNVEFVQVLAPDRVRMRVWERGSGETLSCGTGACAVAWAHSVTAEQVPTTIAVEVPGGEVTVDLRDTSDVVLSGPAEIVASGTLDPHWWRGR